MNTKCTKLSAILLFAAGGLSTVSAQTPVVYQKLGDNPFTLDSSAALQIDSKDRGFLLPQVPDLTKIPNPAHGLMILNTSKGVTGANQLQINIGGTGVAPSLTEAAEPPKWVGFASSSPTISTQKADYILDDPAVKGSNDSTVLFDLSADKTVTTNVSVTLPAVTDANAGKIYVINRIDNNGLRKLIFKINGATDNNGLVLSAGTDVLKELNYAKKITVQANIITHGKAADAGAGTSEVKAVGTWNIINMN